MLQITVEGQEFYDEEKNEFIQTKPAVLQLEHSLVSISKWESKWHKPFPTLNKNQDKMTHEQMQDYIRCMTINHDVDPIVYNALTVKHIREINRYINDPMTATWFSDKTNKKNNDIITSELIYYSMTALNIPFECQKWHINRLLTLIKVCSLKSQPPKKMSKRDAAEYRRSLNASRRARLGSKG